MFGLYGYNAAAWCLFNPAARSYPALVFVHTQRKWIQYGSLLELQDPFLDTPFILAISRGDLIDQKVSQHFPFRNVWHYYPSEPYRFYSFPKD
jgi:hypothetical protein